MNFLLKAIVLFVSSFSLYAAQISVCNDCSENQYRQRAATISGLGPVTSVIYDFKKGNVKKFYYRCNRGIQPRSVQSSNYTNFQYLPDLWTNCPNATFYEISIPQDDQDVFASYAELWRKTGGRLAGEVVLHADYVRAYGSNQNLTMHHFTHDFAFSLARSSSARRFTSRSLNQYFNTTRNDASDLGNALSRFRSIASQLPAVVQSLMQTLTSTITNAQGNITIKIRWPDGSYSIYKAATFLDNFEYKYSADPEHNEIPTNEDAAAGYILGSTFYYNNARNAQRMWELIVRYGWANTNYIGVVIVGDDIKIDCDAANKCVPVSGK